MTGHIRPQNFKIACQIICMPGQERLERALFNGKYSQNKMHDGNKSMPGPVSYTHLTLPTKA